MTVKVKDLFSDGNAFCILGKCRRAAIKAGWSKEQISEFFEEAKAGDYEHLLKTVMEHFDEPMEEDE